MRVLWLCNRTLGKPGGLASGTWLVNLAPELAACEGLELGIIAPGSVTQVTQADSDNISQWIVPFSLRLGRDGLPSAAIVRGIREACQAFHPDVVHVWGTENYWGLLTGRGILGYPALLGMQGLKGAIARVFEGGLSRSEQRSCVGFKELLTHRRIAFEKHRFIKWADFEDEMIRGHKYISIQSPWMKAQVLASNPKAHVYDTERALGAEVNSSPPWQLTDQRPTLFCSSAYPAPFKGLHVAIRALALLRQRFAEIRIRLAGCRPQQGFRCDGYLHWVASLVRNLGLTDTVEWLGPLPGDKIAAELRAASVMIVPTFIESYCVALAEAMFIGTPAVVAFTGGTSYLGRDEESCLFFPPGDAAMCAHQVARILEDRELAQKLSQKSRDIASIRNNTRTIVQKQLETYRNIVAGSSAR